ncbi:cdc42 effector protein 1 [Nothobranchius furzeri]|uniref:CDC42 effector protein (Rho GTPase binding) 1 n=4 Tax=Nothobranchius TaxID=28779 RepID=A0A1A8B5L7_NOTFU|nr:cdc42 effector protein 1 [Nothobranchius furzeri]KAF7204839.1 cdc42 effector protein 1-like [Nothobranchius furzeri]
MNLQEKLSGLKGLVSHSHSKRRFKGDLTVDMISPPLGDFRHTMHVGRGGDVFGDTSFLSNHGGTANGSSEETDSVTSPDNKIGAFFSRTLRQIRRGSDNRPREGSKDLSPPPPSISPIIKNAISLPRLDVDLSNGRPTTRVLFPSSQNTPEEKKSSYGVESGFVTLPRLSRSERQQPPVSITSCSANVHRGSLTDPTDAILSTCSTSFVGSEPTRTTAYSDSLPSLTSLDTFTFDLGPSLMSEVFSLINGHLEEGLPTLDGEEVVGSREGSKMGMATFSHMDSLLKQDCGSGRSLHAADHEEEDEIMVNRVGFSGKVPDVLMGSPERIGMEMERFRSATSVLARHYGVGLRKGQNGMERGEPELVVLSQPKNKLSYSFMDDEDEIKV